MLLPLETSTLWPMKFDIDDSVQDKPTLQTKGSVRNVENLLVIQLTLPDHVSFRDFEYGSWIMQTFCEVLMKQAYRFDIITMFQNIDGHLK